MSCQAFKEYLAAIVDGYKKASKSEKTQILDEAARITSLTRKHLIRMIKQSKDTLLKRNASSRPRQFPRALLIPHFQFLWIQMERASAKRMRANYTDWLPLYKPEGFS